MVYQIFSLDEAAYSAYKEWRHTIQINNDRPVYILPLVNFNVYWPIIGHLNDVIFL